MPSVQRAKDGDTIVTDTGDNLRVANINTPESVHPDKKRNTPEGEAASAFAKDVLPEGTPVDYNITDRDKYDRKVAPVKRMVNGVEIDFGLVQLDQGYSQYYTRFGEHKDPTMHNAYKEFFSRNAPYQMNASEPKLPQEEVEAMALKHQAFTKAYNALQDGSGTQEQFDAALVDLYKDPVMVGRYRNHMAHWDKPTDVTEVGTVRHAMDLVRDNLEWAQNYNRAVKNAGLEWSRTPEEKKTFWEKLDASFGSFNSIAQGADLDAMWEMRKHGAGDIPDNELVKGVPEQYHAVILAEAERFNDVSAATMRDQIIEDIENNKIFDNMEWYAQLGYGAAAIVADPLTVLPAGGLAKGGEATIGAAKLWTKNKAVQDVAKLATWAAGGAVESATQAAPKLAADHTYTAKDYALDTLFDAGFGMGIGVIATAAPKVLKYSKEVRDARAKEQSALEQHIGTDPEATIPLQKSEASGAAQQAVSKVDLKWKAEQRMKSGEINATKPNHINSYVELSAVNTVSKDGFNAAMGVLSKTFPEKSPLRMLINSQLGANNRITDPAMRKVVEKLNADIIKLAAAFPDGKVPKGVGKAIRGITFKQKSYTRNNVMSDLLQGNVAQPSVTLGRYIDKLRNQDIWEGYDPISESAEEFFNKHGHLLTKEAKLDDELFQMTQGLPKDISYIKDVVELNNMAAKSTDQRFKDLVEELNGLVSTRMEQREFGEQGNYADSTKSFGKTVEMSAMEIKQQLDKEGLALKSPERKARRKQLQQHGRVAVSDDVNKIGRADFHVVGKQDNRRAVEIDSIKGKDMDFGELTEQTTLIKDDLDQDLLPRSFTEIEEFSAYKQPSVESLENMRKQLRGTVMKKLGVLEVKGKSELAHQTKRLDDIKSRMSKTTAKAVQAAVAHSGDMGLLVDTIRVSATIAEERETKALEVKRVEATVKPEQDGGATSGAEPDPTTSPLTEEELDGLATGEQLEPDTEARIKSAAEEVAERSAHKVGGHLTKFVASGEKEAFKNARKPSGATDYIGRFLSKMTEDLGTKFQNGKLTSLEYIGSRITEIGRGYGGKVLRIATGSIIRDAVYKQSIMRIAPSYARLIDAYAASKGKGAVGRMNAQQMAGADNAIVKAFNRDVFMVQEYRRTGREIPASVHKSVLDFINDWDKYMAYNHEQLIDAGIQGFTKERRIKNYIPHIWQSGKLLGAISKHGEDKVLRLLEKGYTNAMRYGSNPIDVSKAKELAQRQLDWIKGQADEAVDQYLPTIDSRAQQRLEIDTMAELEGLSILDLLDDDVMGLATKYSNRVAGRVGLAKSTDGMLTGDIDIQTLKEYMIQEGRDKGVDTKKYEQYYDDLIDMMMGRPTRGGLTEEMRELKDLTALTRMGGLGMTQAVETGQVITRSVLNAFSSDAGIKKVFDWAGESPKDSRLLEEIQSISGITNDLEWLDRQSVHLDQAEMAKVNKVRQMSLWIASKGTFGSLKAPASRLLGKTTGYNAIRRAQSRVVQASFTVDVAKHFKHGTGKMGNARMADVGLTDIAGKNDLLKEAFTKHAEWDGGRLVALNVDKWDKAVREQFQYALVRDEAQQIQRTHIGELPPWMNSPMMSIIFQFRQMPLVANNKSLGRAMAFADKEAVVGTMLNTAMAGLVRYAKFAGLGMATAAITGNDWKEPTGQQMDIPKYVNQLGIYADAYDLVMGDINPEHQIPVLGLMKDYYDTLAAKDAEEQAKAVQGLVPLGNTAYGDFMFKALQESLED